MSTIVISYGDLKDAQSQANKVAKRIDDYRDEIKDRVYDKLSKYDGERTENISSAFAGLSAKMSSLKDTKKKFEDYADRLEDVRTECKRTDKAVKSNVYSLTAQFKDSHGISNNPIINALNYFFTSLDNSNCVFRWVKDNIFDPIKNGVDNLKSKIKEWFNYEGGKELVTGIVVAVCEIALAIVAVVAAIGGSVVTLVIAVVAAVFAVVNGIVNIVNECRAYDKQQKNDPASGRRLSDEDKLSDVLREEIGTKMADTIANVLDTVEFVVAVADFVTSAPEMLKSLAEFGDVLKKGYLWSTDKVADLADVSIKDLFSKEMVKGLFGKTKEGLLDGWKALKTMTKDDFVKLAKNGTKEFFGELKDSFFDFENKDDTLDSLESLFEGIKGIAEDGWSGVNDMLMEGLPDITVFNPATLVTGEDGQVSFNFDNEVELDDLEMPTDLFEGLGDLFSDLGDLWSNVSDQGVAPGKDLMDKLSTKMEIDVSIPDIQISPISVPQM